MPLEIAMADYNGNGVTGTAIGMIETKGWVGSVEGCGGDRT